MVYGFAKQSAGHVSIDSQPGQGTSIRIYLPRHVGDAAEEGKDAATVDMPRARGGETVLVVDDEPTVRMLVCEVLGELGYAAIEAGDAREGLVVLGSGHRIDLLITDVGLPNGMNGRQLADAAKTSRPDLRVLFITGYAEKAAMGGGQLGPDMDVITKPFALHTLAAKVGAMITQA
jgi:CheY-like chemotaxis protein